MQSQEPGSWTPWHKPLAQVSPLVHGLLSSHETELNGKTQPFAASHLLSVHTLPSSHLVWSGTCAIVSVASMQLSAVQPKPSVRIGPVPATQPVDGLQVSEPLQNRPSLHLASCGVFTMAFWASEQVSTVHAIPSAGLGGVPATHVVPLQISAPLQNRPSLHFGLCGVLTIESVASSHLSTVQSIPSDTLGALPSLWQPTPGMQVSVPSQNAPLLQSYSDPMHCPEPLH